MKKLFKISLISSVLSASMLLSTAVQAQSSAPIQCPGYEQGKTTLVGERTGKKVQKAFEFYNLDQVDEALEVLYDIDASDDFDKAYVQRFIGNLLAAQDGQGMKALGYLEDAVNPRVLNDLEHTQTLKLLGDLNMQEKKYSEAISYYEQWMDITCKQEADVYTRIANAYYEMGQLDKMIDPADKAIALYEEPNKNPYVLKLTSYYERKMYPETVKVAETLVQEFPETRQWWSQLGFFYMLVENYKLALSTFEMAYIQGHLTKVSEIKALAQLYATNDIPHKSAEIQEKYIKSGLIKRDADSLASLANTLHQAKDYEEAAQYYGEAAKLSSDPEHYRKQGVLLLTAERYKDAITALNNALDRGAEDAGKIHFSLMEANFYAGNFKQAFEHVKEAKKDSSTRRNAAAWEPYIREKAKNRGIKVS
ncbi:tetratricopeptide repeat protein [Alteromonas oceanisediminis]|uniref:tetratricopeptide repeat protein n=1 Tax=Alteromonas oceanisediminis TaxID=2836180 RepID=UPI001BDAAA1A|nr:tetratricopeptide repeat protein [Alteromonas oceanisediminis]MBT0584851.1 tetratricopeptide repeat protein [Alteromonas oceanisediminis]